MVAMVETVVQVCEQPLDPGPCRGEESRWYYDDQLAVCSNFTYGQPLLHSTPTILRWMPGQQEPVYDQGGLRQLLWP